MVKSGHLANEEGKEVGTGSVALCFIPKVLSPTWLREDQTLLALEQSSIYCVIFFSFTHISY